MKNFLMLLAVASGLSAFGYVWPTDKSGQTVTLTAGEYPVANADIATLNTYAGINLDDENAVLVFNITGTASTSVELKKTVTGKGRIVKRGAGILKLTSPNTTGDCTAYYTLGGITIEEGRVNLPANMEKTKTCKIGPLHLLSGTTLEIARNGTASNYDYTRVEGALTGAGTIVTTSSSSSSQLILAGVDERPAEFSGAIQGKIRVIIQGHQYFTGVSNTFSGDSLLQNGNNRPGYSGTVGLMKIGNSGATSSWGTGAITSREYGGTIVYLGTGESTTIVYNYNNSVSGNDYGHCWDAGATGNIIFGGRWTRGDNGLLEKLCLTGSNTVACVLNNEFSGDTSLLPTRITKRGTGTWKFSNSASRKNTGVIAIENGRLQHESIADRGEVCSLGLATCLCEDYHGAYDSARRVPYSIYFGSENGATGTLDAVGTAWSSTRDRAIALAADARIESNSTTGLVAWAGGVSPIDDRTRTLILGGSNKCRNTIGNLNDGRAGGRLNLVKEGTGRWCLDRGATFSGSVDVRAGELEIVNRQLPYYTWFRFTVTAMADDANNGYVGGGEFALYSADGVRRNTGLTPTHPLTSGVTDRTGKQNVISDYSTIRPGEYMYGKSSQVNYYDNGRSITHLFDDQTGEMLNCYVGAANIKYDTPSTWCPLFVLRLPENTPEIVSFDWTSSYGTNSLAVRAVKGWKLEASVDGMIWNTVHEKLLEYDDLPENGNYWYSKKNGEAFAAGQIRRLADGRGYALTSTADGAGYSMLQNVSTINVAAGAVLKGDGTLKLSALSVDLADCGTIDGFKIAEKGTLRLRNLPEGNTLSVPLNFTNCTGVANLAEGQWQIYIDGRRSRNVHLKYEGGSLILQRTNGMMIFVDSAAE